MIQAIRARLTSKFTRLAADARTRDSAFRRFAQNKDGMAAVEFAMVAAPFLALMFAIIQTAIVFFAGQVLETAVADSARLIMTGQAQTQNFTQAQFKQQVCNRIAALFDCANNLYVDVKTYSGGFSSMGNSKPIDANGNLQTNVTYAPGGPGDIVAVRLIYQWPMYVSLYGFSSAMSDVAGKNRLIMATAAFRNEPYK